MTNRISDSDANVQADRDALHRVFDRVAREVARDVTYEALSQPDTSSDVAALRESLIRHRVAAAAMQQCHAARAVVVDVYIDGTKGSRMVVATPTGDRRDEREAMIEAQTASRFVLFECARDFEDARIVAFLFPWLLGGAR